MITYLFQSSICLNVLYLVYVLVFSRSTFFQGNRFYLVIALVSSFIIPALAFSSPPSVIAESFTPLVYPFRDAADISHYDSSYIESFGTLSTGPGWSGIVSWVYAAVLMLLSLRQMKVFRTLFQTTRGDAERTRDGYRIARTNFGFPFSFGRTIYLPQKLSDPMIIEHEKCHIRQAHWADLLMVECAVLIMWFNPVVYFFRRSLKSVHEYQADAHALSACGDLPAYVSCLLQQVRINQSGLISPFFSNTLKQRINMMTKNKTPRIFSALYLLTVPLLVGLMAAFSFHDNASTGREINVDPKRTIKVVIDPAHGGGDKGATATDGTHEKDITLAVAKEIEKAARTAGIQVTLTRTNDVGLTLAQRIAVSGATKADAFISIHADNDPDQPDKGGARLMVSTTRASEADQRLATCLINAIKEPSGKTATLERGDPYVLKNNAVPAVILELGFLSNQQDLTRLSDPEQQRALARSIVKGLLSYPVE